MKPLHSVLEVGIVGATNCVTDPQGKFKQDYGECIFGTLSEAEAKTSDAMVRAWTNFAIYGYVLCKFYQALLDLKRVKKIRYSSVQVHVPNRTILSQLWITKICEHFTIALADIVNFSWKNYSSLEPT